MFQCIIRQVNLNYMILQGDRLLIYDYHVLLEVLLIEKSIIYLFPVVCER